MKIWQSQFRAMLPELTDSGAEAQVVLPNWQAVSRILELVRLASKERESSEV
jgi:hypothetical protein